MSQKDLGACLQVSGPSISQLITKLEENELVKRNMGDKDFRYSLVEVTEKGKEVAINLWKTSEISLNAVFSTITDAEKQCLSELLSKIIFSLDDGKDLRIHEFCEKCGLCTQSYES
jgi:DNA-binding MarR family transcriptional regulator